MLEFKNWYKSNGDGYPPINPDEALRLNEEGWQIHWAINSFNGKDRKEENLKSLDYLFVDADGASKEMIKRKIDLGLPPSIITETMNGFHLYFKIKDILELNGHNKEAYLGIIKERLNPFYFGDDSGVIIPRVARVPCFEMEKDNLKFRVKLLKWNPELIYSISIIKMAYPKKISPVPKGQKIIECNVMDALTKLSGSGYVNGDIFTFKKNSNGTFQIWANRKSTSCWIDRKGGIGNCGYLWQWLAWYGNDKQTILNIHKELKII